MDSNINEEIISGSDTDADTEIYDVDLDSLNTSRSSTIIMNQEEFLPGKWGPIRLYKEASLDDLSSCTAWCMEIGLMHSSSTCYTHRQPRTLRYRSDRDYLTWYCGKCDNYRSVAAGSIFESAKLPLGKVLMLMLSFANNSSYEDAMRSCIFDSDEDLVADTTISRWFDIFREAIVSKLNSINGWNFIGGPGIVVQIDEAQIGRRKYNRGRIKEDTWVFGMIDANGEVRMEICPRRDAATLTGILQRYVAPGSIIHSDGWRAYKGLESLGYKHSTVNHKVEFVAGDGTHTQAIESQWRSLRRMFSPGGRRHEYIADYLVEFIWRQNIRRENEEPFVELIKLFRV